MKGKFQEFIFALVLKIKQEKDFHLESKKKSYHRAKTEEKWIQILAEINNIQQKIKELYNYYKYCKAITKRAKSIQNNLDNFDKDIQKEKDNSGSMWLKLSFLLSIYTSIKSLKISNCNA